MALYQSPKETPASLIKIIKAQIQWMLEKKAQMIPCIQVIQDKGFQLVSLLNPLLKFSAHHEKVLLENAVDLGNFLDKGKKFITLTEQQRDMPFMDEFFKSLDKYNDTFVKLEKIVKDLDDAKEYEPPKPK